MTSLAAPITSTDRLSPTQVTAVLALAQEAYAVDGVFPLDEQVLLRLRHGGEATHLLVADPSGALAGYAQLTVDAQGDATAELVVRPERRRQGLGAAMVAAVTAAHPEGVLNWWAHGDHPAAAALAIGPGFGRVRSLWQLRRPLTTPLPQPRWPAGVVLRAFRPGSDDDAWLALNARAFADHPEQGRWVGTDLRQRQTEEWFDPAGFLLAERTADASIVGFHWTKVHADPALGEVYVLGVDPAAHGLGLGRALTLAGLHHLRERGLDTAMLYVDESNVAAVALYERLGFVRFGVDVSYQR